MHYYCTYLDINYFIRALALYESLCTHDTDNFVLWILCMDEDAYTVLKSLKLPGIETISIDNLEKHDPQLLKAKLNRTNIEYYFTCTPSLPLYILKNYPDIDLITYIDADMYFFSNPAPYFDEIDKHSIAIVEHRFPYDQKHFKIYGTYNVGILSFRNDVNGTSCLKWWREKCLEWCYDCCEEERYADQKYLDKWPSKFQNLIVIKNIGINAAPWNIKNYCITMKGSTILVDDDPLILYHFHGLKQINRFIYYPFLDNYDMKLTKIIKQKIYV